MTVTRSQTVYVSCINAVLQTAEAVGVDRRLLLREAGISPALLSIPSERVSLEQYTSLYESSCNHTGDPDLGLRVGRVTYFLGLNLHLYMTTICSNLKQYLNVIPSTINLRGDLGRVLIRPQGDFIRLEWHPLNLSERTARLVSDEMLASSAFIVGSICAQPVPVIAAEMNYPRPSNTKALEQAFGSDLKFDCDVSCLYFSRDCLRFPLISLDYELGQDFTATSQSLLEDSTGLEDPFLHDLRSAMRRTLPTGELTIDSLAEEVGVSRRTLQRRLTDRDSSFKQLLQNLREELSLHYLNDSRLGITEIAFLLGYSDQASFSNAFRAWRDCSPSEYRNNHHKS
ncbi:MAG: AraC family transcriptional regulator ligand-binding domain-containing protein [Halioglobus sp.]